VTTFASAEDFLSGLDEEQPDCAVLDVHLPCMNGIELQQQLKSRGWHFPTVFITADREIARSDLMRRSGVPCLVKPCDAEVVIAAILDLMPRPSVAPTSLQ
jgi:two-component system response regulator FixJ